MRQFGGREHTNNLMMVRLDGDDDDGGGSSGLDHDELTLDSAESSSSIIGRQRLPPAPPNSIASIAQNWPVGGGLSSGGGQFDEVAD